MDADGRISTPIESDPAAKKWADSMTARYDQLAIVEPVFGQIKAALGFGQFLLRGLRKIRGEWRLVTTAHNLRKLIAATA